MHGKTVNVTILDNWISQSAPKSHGTICASILAEQLPDFLELSILSASDSDKAAGIENVCTALKHCLKTLPDYLSLSIGTSNWLQTDELGKLTKKLSDAGTHIFAACANNGHIAFPAAYPWVTGVRYEPGIIGLYREENSSIGCNLVVGDFTTPVLEKLAAENSFFNCRTNSMAAPYALGKMLSEELSMADLPLWTGRTSVEKPNELPMPVAALRGPLGKMKELLALFQQESYQAALLTDRQNSDWTSTVLHVEPSSFFGWAKPLEEAGILLLDMEGALASFQQYADYSIDLTDQDVTVAFKAVLNFFGVEEEDAEDKT